MQIIEFGTGDGSPVIHALETWGQYTGVIHGFEISPSAATAARHSAAAHGVSNQYKVQLCAHLFGFAILGVTSTCREQQSRGVFAEVVCAA